MKKSSKIFLSVIIPCYNEEANLRRGVLREVDNYMRKRKYSWEVIISDDGSTDQSRSLVKKQIKNWKKFKLLQNPHGGKPSALLSGLKKAKGKYVLFVDMDQSTPITELGKLIPFVKGGYEVVIGSRGINRKNFPIYRKIGAVVFMTLRKALILPTINDTQCGFKLFNKGFAEEAFPKLSFFKRKAGAVGWTVTSYDVELLHTLDKSGTRIKEIQVAWNDQDVSTSKGGSLNRYVRESVDMLKQILRVKVNELRGMYD